MLTACRRLPVIAGITMAIATSIMLAAPTFAATENAEGAKAANEKFYAALNSIFTGDTSAMENVWSHADDAVYMGPDGGFDVGWKPIAANWKKQAKMKLGGTVSPEELKITVGKEIAIVHDCEKGQNINSSGKPVPVSIRATNIFRHEDGKWKMIGHHTDKLSYLDK